MIRFTDPYDRSAETLAKRIAILLYGDDRGVEYNAAAQKWHVGSANDFWLRQWEHGVFAFTWRYDPPGAAQAYRFFLEHHLALRLDPPR